MNIVIADDDRLVSGALKLIPENSSNITVSALGQDGGEAIALYEKYRPDLLLMDIRMEPMNGLDASCRILKPDSAVFLPYVTSP